MRSTDTLSPSSPSIHGVVSPLFSVLLSLRVRTTDGDVHDAVAHGGLENPEVEREHHPALHKSCTLSASSTRENSPIAMMTSYVTM
mmetsp:Transcript_6262/g.17016  ORF Transcript_6262/g.17016 Transcript_6262/m.17016 type:complete len:86 (-) Transcript_6262:421-678(-)